MKPDQVAPNNAISEFIRRNGARKKPRARAAFSSFRKSISAAGMGEELQNLREEMALYQAEVEAERSQQTETRSMLETAAHRYSDLFDFAPVAFVLLDRHGFIYESNLTASSVFGVSREKLRRTLFSRFLAKQGDHRKLLNHLLRCRRSVHPQQTTTELNAIFGGKSVVIQLVSVPEAFPTNGTQFYRTAVLDITEREQASRYGRQLADVVEASPDAIYSTDSHHVITSWNSGAQNIYGWSAKEMIGQPGWRIVPNDRLAEMRQIWTVLRAGQNIRQHETLRLRKDGSRAEISLSASPIHDREGLFAGMSMVARDVSRRKRMEQRMRQQTEELTRIMEAVPAVVWVAYDSQCREVYGNDFAAALFHIETYTNVSPTPPPGVRPLPIRYFRHGRRLKPNELPMQRAAATGKPQPLEEIDFELPDGRKLTLLGSATPLFDERQKVRGVVAALSDISERKKAQDVLCRANEMLERKVRERTSQLLQLNAKLRREVAERRNLQHQVIDISEREQRRIGQDIHDGLGQQLTGIAMLADALRDKLKSKKLGETEDARRVTLLLQQARSQTRRLAHGLQPVSPDPDGLMLSLKELAESVTDLGVDCRFQCPAPVHLHDNLKATHLFRIAQEAIGNALRHGQCRKIKLSLSVSNGSLRLEIRSDGRKFVIPPNRKSSGMGLQLMKFRSEAIGGTLQIRPLAQGGALIACNCMIPVTGENAQSHGHETKTGQKQFYGSRETKSAARGRSSGGARRAGGAH